MSKTRLATISSYIEEIEPSSFESGKIYLEVEKEKVHGSFVINNDAHFVSVEIKTHGKSKIPEYIFYNVPRNKDENKKELGRLYHPEEKYVYYKLMI